jgi:hypothetical protein
MSDTPETEAAVVASNGQWSFLLKATCERLERERNEARHKLADWEDSAKHVRSEWPDEQHCSCVPILRKLLKDAERERDEARAERDILRLDAQREAEHHDRMITELEGLYDKNAKLRDIAERAIDEMEGGDPVGTADAYRAALEQLKEGKK